MMKKIKKILRKIFKPIRGVGFPGDGRQRQRSKQVEVFDILKVNKIFKENFPELLACNEARESVADKIDISADIENYFGLTKAWMNYAAQVPDLKDWRDSKGHAWPNLHPALQHVIDTYKEIKPSSVCDIGAGAGVVSKYIFAASGGQVNLTCLEGSDAHIAAMKQNFFNSDIIPPKMDVKANIVKGFAQSLPFGDNSFDMVFTCTVMMHMPFIAAVLAACEMARVSSKYILHVEGYHVDGIPKNVRGKYNSLLIDYERLYAKLGYKKVKKFFYRDPYETDYDYVVFLAEKIK